MDSTEIIGIGLMCGTSQDALDMCAVKFKPKNSQYQFEIIQSDAIKIPSDLRNKLQKVFESNALNLALLDIEVGKFFGSETKTFIEKHSLDIHFIASHGITIFHQPEQGLTLQIGSGAEIAAITGIDTICNFRNIDVALGGQGAPLVPFADLNLFNTFDFTLNLGGFSNLTSHRQPLQGFDVTVCNLALNYIVSEMGLSYDEGGLIASKGKSIPEMLSKLNHLEYFELKPPKSLGREWFDKNFAPILDQNKSKAIEDRLYTVCEHIGQQIGVFLNMEDKSCLVSGGGAFNETLIGSIKKFAKTEITLASTEIINFKEAICFAFLGACRLGNFNNTLCSVTGAERDSIGGAVYLGKR